MNTINRRLLHFFMLLAVMSLAMPANTFASEEAVSGKLSYTEVIPQQYDDVRTFSEGLAAVKRGDKWGYINLKGDVVIDFQYDRAHSFSEGKALVEKHEDDDTYDVRVRSYYIITPDNKIKPLLYADRPFENLDFEFQSGNWLQEMYDTTFYNGYISVPADTPNGKFVFDENGKAFDDSFFLPTEGTLAKYDHYSSLEYTALYEGLGFIRAFPFNQGMAPVAYESEEEKDGYYYTFLKKDGTLWSGPKFYNLYVYDIYKSYQIFNDYSLASLKNAEGKWGAVNKAGTTVIPFEYEQLRTFNEGVAAFSKNGKFGFIDVHGHEVIVPQFDDVSSFSNGIASVRLDDTAYLIDKKGDPIKGSEDLPVDSYFRKGQTDENGDIHYVVTPPGKYVLSEKDGKYGIGRVDYIEKVISAAGVRVDQTKVELETGQTTKLVATILPVDTSNKRVTWTSSNEKVATVDAYGNVTAKSKGHAVITVTTEDGSHTAASDVSVRINPYADYKLWSKPLQNDSAVHSWTVTLNMKIDQTTVDSRSAYIVDKDYNKLDFIQPISMNDDTMGRIILKNNGAFQKGENYWIIIENTVSSSDGKKLSKSLKAPFTITE